MKTIPYGRQYIDSKDIKSVAQALKQNLITTGNYVKNLKTKSQNFLKLNM